MSESEGHVTKADIVCAFHADEVDKRSAKMCKKIEFIKWLVIGHLLLTAPESIVYIKGLVMP